LLILDPHCGNELFRCVRTGAERSPAAAFPGGSTLLWQHLFWFFGHPEVYIAILPSIGIVATILPVFARKPLLGPRATIGCMIAIGFLSYMVWGHHMFVSGMNPFSANLFSVPTLFITIPRRSFPFF